MYCSKCGKQASDGDKFCHSCGLKIRDSETTENAEMKIEQINSAKRNSNSVILTVVITLGILIALFLGITYFKLINKSESTTISKSDDTLSKNNIDDNIPTNVFDGTYKQCHIVGLQLNIEYPSTFSVFEPKDICERNFISPNNDATITGWGSFWPNNSPNTKPRHQEILSDLKDKNIQPIYVKLTNEESSIAWTDGKTTYCDYIRFIYNSKDLPFPLEVGIKAEFPTDQKDLYFPVIQHMSSTFSISKSKI